MSRSGSAASIHGVLLVDKARGVSSHLAVALVRKALSTRAVGHAGTLDPMATGLLVLGVGEGTKLLRYLIEDDKMYRATVALGVATDTWDADGQEVARCPVPALSLSGVRALAQRFVGPIVQRPPAVSAIKRGGEPLYKKVRRGEAVEAPLRRVQVHALHVLAAGERAVSLTVCCGKGFYVRSLAHDLAQALGTAGHLGSLRRERSGRFSVGQALPFDLLERAARREGDAQQRVQQGVIPLADALTCMPRAILDRKGQEHARHGRAIPLSHVVDVEGALPGDERPVALLDGERVPLAVAVVRDAQLRVVRGLRCA